MRPADGEAEQMDLHSSQHCVGRANPAGRRRCAMAPARATGTSGPQRCLGRVEEKDRQLLEKDRQLAEKDKQIAMLMEQSNNLTQALQAAQALAAADKKQLLLQSGQQNEQPENPDPSENVKKGFFRKIFGK